MVPPPSPNAVKRRVFLLLLPLSAIVSFGLGLHGLLSGRVATWAATTGMATAFLLLGFSFAFRRWQGSFETIERLMIGLVALIMASTVLIGAFSHEESQATFELIRQGIWLPVVYGVGFLVLAPRWGAALAWALWLVLVVASSSHLLHPDGHNVSELGSIVEILVSNAVVILVLMGVAWVIRAGERRAASMEFVANTDTLTGLANRRNAERKLEIEVERSTRYGRPLSVVLFDLDLFKAVNDNFGHERGDEVLQQVPITLAGRIRETDLLARWGGEEFLIVSPEMDLEQATQMAERFRRLIEGHDFGTGWPITASFGVAQRTGSESAGDVVRRADEAMYAAKRNGRNAVWNSLRKADETVVEHHASGAPTRTSDRLPPITIEQPAPTTANDPDEARTTENTGKTEKNDDADDDDPPLAR